MSAVTLAIDAILDELEPLRAEDVNWFVARGVAEADLRLPFPLHRAGDDVVVTIPNSEGEPIDFVRWNLSTGRRQAVTGEAWAVGEAIVDVLPLHVPIPVHSGLLGRLRARNTGLVILDPRRAAIALCGRPTSTTPDFAERLHAHAHPAGTAHPRSLSADPLAEHRITPTDRGKGDRLRPLGAREASFINAGKG